MSTLPSITKYCTERQHHHHHHDHLIVCLLSCKSFCASLEEFGLEQPPPHLLSSDLLRYYDNGVEGCNTDQSRRCETREEHGPPHLALPYITLPAMPRQVARLHL
ncbi:hypothetical protein E2C01_060337 [Portunus trituberculatus]|uniref:Uncharacterized protein n=1 Tax=Portunus trituberculatus TaxID=210409 RepID=A0A5B7H0W3_PORTR|nr:hypothetical protein [Portunus trituberculatus]